MCSERRLSNYHHPLNENSPRQKDVRCLLQRLCLILLLIGVVGCDGFLERQVDKALQSGQFMAREFEELFARTVDRTDETARDLYREFAEKHSKALIDRAAERFGQEMDTRAKKYSAHTRDFIIQIGNTIESYGPLARAGNAGFVPYVDDILRDVSRIETDPGTSALGWPEEILYWNNNGRVEARSKDATEGDVATVVGYGFAGRDRQLRYHQVCVKGKDGQLRWIDPIRVTRLGSNEDRLEITLSKLDLQEGDQALRVRFLGSALVSIPLTPSELRTEEKDFEFEDAFAATKQNVLTVYPRKLDGAFREGARRWDDGGAEKSKAAFASVELRQWGNRIFYRPYVEISNYDDRAVRTEPLREAGHPAAPFDPATVESPGTQWRELTAVKGAGFGPEWKFSRFISPDREGEHNYFQKHLGKQTSDDYGAGGMLDRIVVWGTSGGDDIGPGDQFTRAEFHLRKIVARFYRTVAP